MKFILKTSKVSDGNMSFEWGKEAEVLENRKKFLEQNNFKIEDCVFMDLEHGDEVAIVSEKDKGTKLTADTLITNTPGVVLFLMTADCLPLALHDEANNAIALVHLGWKSSDLNLAAKTVEAMTREFGSDPKSIKAYIGPGIHKESYLVQNPSQKDNPKWVPFLEEAVGYTKVDLIGFNLEALTNAGLMDEHIEVSPEDTAVSPEYFSHVRSKKTLRLPDGAQGKPPEPEGRFATVATLR